MPAHSPGFSADDAISRSLAEADPLLGRVIRRVGSAEFTPAGSRFALLARTIIGQQLSEASARAIAERVTRDIGLTPEAIAEAPDSALRTAGLSGRKLGYLRSLSSAVRSGALDLDALDDLNDAEIAARLTGIPGIGPWTAQMFLLLALGRPDVLVTGDAGIRSSAGHMLGLGRAATPVELETASQRWRPNRSAAMLYLYRDMANRDEGGRDDDGQAQAGLRTPLGI